MTRTIRTLTLAEISALLDWAADEGWNPGLNDAVAFQAADPEGFIGAFVGGQMVAAIAAVAYDGRFGFIGLYICHKDWRGQGHGKAVWDAGMAHLGGRTIGLDGVAEQQANYARMGFVPVYETIRMSGMLPGGVAQAEAVMDIGDTAGLEAACFPALRGVFLRHWLQAPNQSLLYRDEHGVAAYGVVRPCREGAKIGPLFAHNEAAALACLGGILGAVHIDVPAIQTSWLETLAGLGFTPGFRTRRMYRGTPPRPDMARVFGITSLELG
jgi:GNAT superfamily N-acetyltransferase